MGWYQQWRNVFRPDRLDDELESELQYHLAETVDKLVAAGMSARDAEREARRRLGNYGIQKERTRDMNVAAWLDGTRADLVYAARQLRLNPGFTAIAVLSLALGIGANSAMFQLVNAIRLKMLPVAKPQELAYLDWEKGSARAGNWSTRSANFTSRQYDLIRDQQQAFTGVFAWSAARFNLTTGGEPRYAEGVYVSGNLFELLGVRTALGRTLTTADDGANCTAGTVLSYAFWQREFAGDPGVLGRTVNLDGHAMPVIGVTTPSFLGVEVGNRYDLAVPLCADRLMAEDGKGRAPQQTGWWLSLMGRMRPGWTVEKATAYLHAYSPSFMQASLPEEYNPSVAKRFLANRLMATEGGTGVSSLRDDYERPLWLLMAITGLVLAIACANLANLLLARGTVREREIAVRLAVGASRGRLVRQLLAESFLLAVSGAAAGAAVAVVLSRGLIGFLSTPTNPVEIDIAPDARVLLFTAGLAALTCVLFGLLPALRATVQSPSSAMRSGGRSVTAGRERFQVRRVLVATQVALSFVLLAGALLFVRSLHNLMTVDAGFRADGVMAVVVDLSKAGFAKERRMELYRGFVEKFAATPGVVSAARVDITPVSGSGWNQNVGADGARAMDSDKQAFLNRVSPGYFRTMATRILAGRDFDARDTLTSPKVAIVNEAFARRFFGGANPVGHLFQLNAPAGKPEPVFQIVGMVANTKYHDLREEFPALGFFPSGQNESQQPGAVFVVRVAGSPAEVMQRVKAELAATSGAIGVEFRPLSAQLAESVLREKLMATLSGGFGLLAGMLAMLGLYGVIAYMVARRRNEMGVRMALGAGRGHVVALVLREAVVLLGVGLAAGVVLVLWTGKAAATLLYGLAANDVGSLAGAGVVLIAVALVASYVPARRAAGVDPMLALRNE